jgi:hypothetical protein
MEMGFLFDPANGRIAPTTKKKRYGTFFSMIKSGYDSFLDDVMRET